MHNIKLIRKNFDEFKKKILDRDNSNLELNKIILLDRENRELIQKKENLEKEKKKYLKKK